MLAGPEHLADAVSARGAAVLLLRRLAGSFSFGKIPVATTFCWCFVTAFARFRLARPMEQLPCLPSELREAQ